MILIITGPQGSGNHLFSKIFALSPEVRGWSALNKKYWIGHDQEPFAEYWRNPKKLSDFDWTQSEYFVTSVSCPYMDNGEPTIPKYQEFIAELDKVFQQILNNPFLFQEVYKDFRKVNTGKFPYKIIYRIASTSIIIISVVHLVL